MSQMLAPARLLELVRDPRIIAAAVANATNALTKGLSAANQKFVFMLIILSIRRSTFHKGRNFFFRFWARTPRCATTHCHLSQPSDRFRPVILFFADRAMQNAHRRSPLPRLTALRGLLWF